MLYSSLRAVAIGFAIGLGGALLLSRVLQASLFGVGGADFTSYAAALLLLAFTAAIACWIPARRATLVNPIVALRTE